ncbi:DNA repair protein [Vibrio salinus]|uniref:DNA repair protein n=1 Tax=Vibrio salinus TaxID=2899784 RepID=UPI001E5A9347|nr:DNA repair protein [Vibrio salinus]MCE0492877.1 DNA repair protein [Vibrio salinus]
MNIGLIIALIAILLVLVLGYNIMLQSKAKSDAAKKQEIAKYVAIIDATEDLIGNAHHIPFSKSLLVCLNTRILDALQNMYSLDPKNKSLTQRIEDVSNQVASLKKASDNESTTFKSPTNDKQAIVMLKLVKRLRDTIRSEHNKGRFETQSYVAENARLEGIQIRINIENVIKRANESISKGQPGTAIQLLKRGIEVLSSKNDAYSNQARGKLQEMFDDLEKKRQAKAEGDQKEHIKAENERDSDMEALFGEKKKW